MRDMIMEEEGGQVNISHSGHSSDPIKDKVIHYLTDSKLHGQHMVEFAVIILAVVGVSLTILIRKNIILRNLLEKLRRLDAAKSHFISVAAHQLRTPLSEIKWTLDLMLKNTFGEITPKQKEYLEGASATQERMTALVDGLLDVSKIEQGGWDYAFGPTDLADLVKSSVKGFEMEAVSKNIKLNFEPPENKNFQAMVDRDKIKLVLDNLISNALKYTPSGGSASVTLEDDENNFKIAVADSGIGVPKEEQQEIFSKFHRLDGAIKMSPDGSGLGLFIAKSIVLRHGGNIAVQSEQGQGSKFVITLPKNNPFATKSK